MNSFITQNSRMRVGVRAVIRHESDLYMTHVLLIVYFLTFASFR